MISDELLNSDTQSPQAGELRSGDTPSSDSPQPIEPSLQGSPVDEEFEQTDNGPAGNESEADEHSEQEAGPSSNSEARNDEHPAPSARRERKPKARPERKRERREKPKRPSGAFRKFVMVSWSGKREPVDDMFYAEAEREGDWIVIREFEQVRSRKEILERLQALPSGLVAFDFNFSYPKEFVEFLKAHAGIDGWRSMTKKVREDLKKNADDGVRLWIERMGKYRESNLDPHPAPQFERRDLRRDGDRRDRFSNNRFQNDRFAGERRTEPLPPYEQPSLAERFRRTDLALKKAAGQHLNSPIQIGYNRLTNRYEFNDPNVRGRAALMGLAMLDQLLEVRPEIAMWPIMRPKEFTIVEMLPWVFTDGKTLDPERLRKLLAIHEDNGWDIPDEAVDLAARNPDAQRTLLCLMGMIKTETRENRERRPIRDYVDAFYQDPQVCAEGWFYSIGYRVLGDRKDSPKPESKKEDERPAKRERTPRPPRMQTEENPIIAEASSEVIEQLPAPEAAEIVAAE